MLFTKSQSWGFRETLGSSGNFKRQNAVVGIIRGRLVLIVILSSALQLGNRNKDKTGATTYTYISYWHKGRSLG